MEERAMPDERSSLSERLVREDVKEGERARVCCIGCISVGAAMA